MEMDQSNEEMKLSNEVMGSSLEEISLSTLRKDVDAHCTSMDSLFGLIN